jgi:hypothetical protein
MTYFALQAIRAANYRITYGQLDARLSYLVEQGGYEQSPQVEGKSRNKKRQIFT